LWYAPLLPFTPQAVRRYREIMGEVLARHGFDPLLAVTSRSPRVLSATIPLLFDPANPEDVARAKLCYRDLVSTGLRRGWPPYRLGVDYMDLIGAEEGSPEGRPRPEQHHRAGALFGWAALGRVDRPALFG
jgi:hypothetical protein